MTYIQQTCKHPGCTKLQCVSNKNVNGTGKSMYRLYCNEHYANNKAKNAGFNSILEYVHNRHPYLKHRKSFCENVDGRLGFVCNCEIHINAQLQVDHIDGNSENNEPENLQTLCANCHIFKTHLYKDYATPGRKTLKLHRDQGGIFNFAKDW
jgi:5-methylcytosine-specific restriction endonuclease McrA